jgi:kynureninase
MENNLGYARKMDEQDPLRELRDAFHQSGSKENPLIYFCGNSLGLEPKSAKAAMERELEDWKRFAIDGFQQAKFPWLDYHDQFVGPLGQIAGALPSEIAVMNGLTVNLHLMLSSLYRPDKKRFRIIMEEGAFPSDRYAVVTQLQFHGIDPKEGLVEIGPRAGEKLIVLQDLEAAMHRYRDSLSLILIGGINYYSGQLFDIKALTRCAHQVGAMAGFDLAHAIGNVPLRLHEWDVDFAVWCSYKYLNGGPGAVGGAFLHERISKETERFRLAGWWGNDARTRFEMKKEFEAQSGAGGWQISTPQVMNMVCLASALEIYQRAGVQKLREKSERLTAYLEFLLGEMGSFGPEIITGSRVEGRGAQLSLFYGDRATDIHQRLTAAGVVTDYRSPGVIRMAPAPLYNSFEEVFQCCSLLGSLLLDQS